ncbi:MAG TPA: hypothetical protein VN381_16155 [Anaerovoracaceae bacterium]|nr:hypothetical protein [Anaerovoracaceae bacterium]
MGKKVCISLCFALVLVSNMDGICSLNIIGTYTATSHTVLEGNKFVQKEESSEWTWLDVNIPMNG